MRSSRRRKPPLKVTHLFFLLTTAAAYSGRGSSFSGHAFFFPPCSKYLYLGMVQGTNYVVALDLHFKKLFCAFHRVA